VGVGVRGFGAWVLGPNPHPPTPNPQSPIPNPQSPIKEVIVLKKKIK